MGGITRTSPAPQILLLMVLGLNRWTGLNKVEKFIFIQIPPSKIIPFLWKKIPLGRLEWCTFVGDQRRSDVHETIKIDLSCWWGWAMELWS